MANGHAALLLLAPEPAGAPTGKPSAAPDLPTAGIELEIGAATVGAVLAIAFAITAYAKSGQFTDTARTVGGECLSKLAMLRLNTFGRIDDFSGIAHKQGRNILCARHGVALREQLNLDEAGLEKALAELIGYAVTIAEKVARDEQAFVRAQAN
jgi:hypothetical protein